MTPIATRERLRADGEMVLQMIFGPGSPLNPPPKSGRQGAAQRAGTSPRVNSGDASTGPARR